MSTKKKKKSVTEIHSKKKKKRGKGYKLAFHRQGNIIVQLTTEASPLVIKKMQIKTSKISFFICQASKKYKMLSIVKRVGKVTLIH